MKKDTERCQQIIEDLLKEHNIILKRWRKSDSGIAYVKKRMIEIPKPTNIQRFCTCLHEIEHVINPKATSTNNPVWQSEYLACSRSERKCRKYGFIVPEKEHNRNKNYVKMIIGKFVTSTGTLTQIPNNVLKYAEINRKEWTKNLKQNLSPKIICLKSAWEEVETQWE